MRPVEAVRLCTVQLVKHKEAKNVYLFIYRNEETKNYSERWMISGIVRATIKREYYYQKRVRQTLADIRTYRTTGID